MIPTFSVEDLKDVPRLAGDIQLISHTDFPPFFIVQSEGSRFFFINLVKFIDFETARISGLVVEAVSAEEFAPPSSFRRVVNLFVDTDTERLVVRYDDQPV